MSYNGSGTFQINTSGQPVVAGTVISSTAFNALTADLATGLSTAITKDGQTTTTARIPFAAGINSTLVTDSTNTTSGSIITAGGVGVAKALYVGTTANIAGVTTVQAGTALLPAITTTGDTNTGIFFPAADTIAFSEGGVEAMRIDSAGNIGASVTPSAWKSNYKAVQVGNAAAVAGRTDANNNYFSSNWYVNSSNQDIYQNTGFATTYSQGSGTHAWFTAPSGTAGNTITFTQAMTLDASGRLGIGATSLSANLQVENASAAAELWLQRTGYNAVKLYGSTLSDGNGFKINVNGGDRLAIDSSGNLLVGATSTDSSRANFVDSSKTTGSILRASAGSASFTGNMIEGYGVRTSTNGSYKLIALLNGDASGVFNVLDSGNAQNTNNSYGGVSDAKLKENVIDATPKLGKLNQVRVVNYNLIGSEQKQIGVIAQELEQIFPSMVEETTDRDKNGNDLGTTTKAVKYSVFVPMLIKALQEQQAIIQTLTDRITALEQA